MTDPAMADAAAAFEVLRSRLLGIAYRILGGVFDAEDVVKDVWVRWQGTDHARVRDRVAFLVTVTTRVALNETTSSHARREVSVAGQLSKCDFASADPAIEAERREALEVTARTRRLRAARGIRLAVPRHR
jgi:DNA-directed RNA polymerase specialized sigma24 family protein